MRTYAPLAGILTGLLAIGFTGQTKQMHQSPPEQFHFDLEQPVNVPATIPSAILQVLRHNPTVLAGRCKEKNPPGEAPGASLFEASVVHLASADESDMVVKGKDSCLFGANVGPFWIFRNSPKGYSLVFSVSALGIEILEARSHGYRSVRAGAVVAGKTVDRTYEFDGVTYQKSDKKVSR